MSAEWPEGEANNVSLPTIVSSTDLFDGELFGDELIDIYNNEATGDNGDNNEIPSLLASGRGKTDDEQLQLHPGAQMALTAAGMDDGLGAFRPSTSFNDLSSLLTDTATASAPATANTQGDAATPDAASKSAPVSTKKRPATAAAASSAPPAAKRRTSDTTTAPIKTQIKKATKPDAVVSSQPAVDKAENADDTPNPLSLPEVEAVAKPSVKPKTDGDVSADFKSIAQAAVSNLIFKAATTGTTKVELVPKVSPTTAPDAKVDTSTAHIKALTGNNWVSACAGASTGIVPVAPVNDDKNANRARRQNLTPDERARQNRDRNREHARNTRLRKKAYVEELKRTLTELVAQRDASDLEKRQTAQREAEQREVRFRVIEEFLKLRGRNEPNFARWAAILEDGFTLTLPMTTFRETVSPTGNASHEQVLNGVPEIMADATNFANFLQAFKGEGDGIIGLQYECDRKNFFMDECNAVLEWTAKSTNKVADGQFYAKGLIRGYFSPASNKLITSSISFDTGIVQAQLNKRALNSSPQEAAEVAANQAGALLDSLQVPRISVAVPSAVTLVPPSSSSESSAGDKDDSLSSDGSDTDRSKPSESGMTTRRALRRSS